MSWCNAKNNLISLSTKWGTRDSNQEYTTLDTRVDNDSSFETIESIPTSVDKLGAKLIGNQEQPKPDFSKKKAKRILIKKIICFTLLNACTITGLMIIAICLSDIGLGSIVATNGIFTVSDFLVNLLICFICDRIPRKRSLIILNMITLCFGICFVIISVTTDYNKKESTWAWRSLRKGRFWSILFWPFYSEVSKSLSYSAFSNFSGVFYNTE